MIIDNKNRYIQFAFNKDIGQAKSVIGLIPNDHRIIIEAGTPFIKREGLAGLFFLRQVWGGTLIADFKVMDGAAEEVRLAHIYGYDAITALGSAPKETLDIFTNECKRRKMFSMIDMLGVENPMKVLQPLKNKPDIVVIHKGRDEEKYKRAIIRYKDISKITSKYGSLIAVAGGLDLSSLRKAYFNGANIAIVNVVESGDKNKGLNDSTDTKETINKMLIEVKT